MSELVATAAATTVARGVDKGVIYFNAWWRDDPALAVAVAANSDTALIGVPAIKNPMERRQGIKF